MKAIKTFTNGLLKENPVLRLVLGTCPTLAITTTVSGSLGMGLAATFVLICSNMVISALRKVIPDKVRLPAYIVVIATFVTILKMMVQAYVPALTDSLGVYLDLIVVNCIILGRAEMFASKNGVILSGIDGLGMGLGFTLTLVLMGSIREILGSGSWFNMPLFGENFTPMSVFVMPAGGFFVFGVLMAAAVFLETKTGHRIKRGSGCGSCPNAEACAAAQEEQKQEEAGEPA